MGQLLALRLDPFGERLHHIVAASLLVLHFAMEGQGEENQNRDDAVDNDPEDGHSSPPKPVSCGR